MEQEQKTSPVDIVQKLIAIHTTRKEATEKMLKNSAVQDLQDKLRSAISQSDRFTKALLNELSEFGDAVTSEVNRQDEYQTLYNAKTGDIDTMNAESLTNTFSQLEKALVNTYKQIADAYHDLPVSVNDLLHQQIEELHQTAK